MKHTSNIGIMNKNVKNACRENSAEVISDRLCEGYPGFAVFLITHTHTHTNTHCGLMNHGDIRSGSTLAQIMTLLPDGTMA